MLGLSLCNLIYYGPFTCAQAIKLDAPADPFTLIFQHSAKWRSMSAATMLSWYLANRTLQVTMLQPLTLIFAKKGFWAKSNLESGSFSGKLGIQQIRAEYGQRPRETGEGEILISLESLLQQQPFETLLVRGYSSGSSISLFQNRQAFVTLTLWDPTPNLIIVSNACNGVGVLFSSRRTFLSGRTQKGTALSKVYSEKKTHIIIFVW